MKRFLLISLALVAVPLSACTRTTAPTVAAPRYEQPVSNAAVYDAQRRLAELGYYRGPLDGVSGASTRDAIEHFQADRQLAVNGDLNDATVAALDRGSATARNYPPYERPVTAVGPVTTRAVQERLRRTGYYRGPLDGTWGPETRLAMERFQRDRGLRVTGTPTPRTMTALGLRSEAFMSGSSVPPPSVADELNREEYYRQWR